MNTKYRNITHVCISCTVYSLLQYLMYVDEDTAKNHTFYIFNESIKPSIRKKFFHEYFPCANHGPIMEIIKRCWKIYAITIYRFLHPFMKRAAIYATDHVQLSLFMGKREYTLLEEAPNAQTFHANPQSAEFIREEQKKKTIRGKIMRLLYGEVAVSAYGNNPQCTKIMLTEENNSPILKEKQVEVKTLRDMWENASRKKQKYICEIFDVSHNDIALMEKAEVLFLTQPLAGDGILTVQEYKTILQQIFNHYPNSQILIKQHPRDDYDYATQFPDKMLFAKPVSLELLVLLGTKMKKVVSICSTAVDCIPENVELDWFGVEVHPKIKTFLGNTLKPHRKYNRVTL